jgi:hypothetical protein
MEVAYAVQPMMMDQSRVRENALGRLSPETFLELLLQTDKLTTPGGLCPPAHRQTYSESLVLWNTAL